MRVLIVLLAGCPAAGPPPAAAPAAPVDLEAVCPTTPPRGYRIERGEASGPDAGVALAEARDAAGERLLAKLCSGLSDARCAALRRQVKPWQQGMYDPRTGFACASVVVPADAGQSLDDDASAVTTDLGGLAQTIADGAGAAPVFLPEPQWVAGCDAGPAGQQIKARLVNALAQRGVGLAGKTEPAAATVQLRLTPGPSALTLTATLDPPEGVARPLPGFEIPVDVLDLASTSELGRCAPEAPAEPEPAPGRRIDDGPALTEWLTAVVTGCDERHGRALQGLGVWWIRFRVDAEGQVRGLQTMPEGAADLADVTAPVSMRECIRREIRREAWQAGIDGVYKAAIQSGVTDREAPARELPDPGGDEPGDVGEGEGDAMVSLVFRNPSGDWAEVWVDGALAAEFRNQQELVVRVTPGVHTLEVRAFMQTTPFAEGQLDTLDAEHVAIGIDVGRGILRAYNHEDGWVPRE